MGRKLLKVFVSSPGDVPEERALTERVLRRLGEQYRDHVRLLVVLWEHEPLFAHDTFQSQIERPSQCDLVISILWSRLGTRLPPDFAPAPGVVAPTGTEFEVQDALDAFRLRGRPHLLIYRRTTSPQVDVSQSDVRERVRQYEALEEFCGRVLRDARGELLAHHLYAEPWEFERKLTEHTRKWLERQTGESRPQPRWTDGSPYRGLQTFEAKHKDIYFGRSQATSEVLRRLSAVEAGLGSVRFLLVQGMSGVGKSSLIRAGVLPLLEGRAVEGIGVWEHAILKPSDVVSAIEWSSVFGALAARLLSALPGLAEAYSAQRLAERLLAAPDEVAARLDGYLSQAAQRRGLMPSRMRLVVCVDQLEESWNSLPDTARAAFGRCLVALSREGRIWVIATIRSDFVGRMEETPEYVPLLKGGVAYTLLPPQPDELMEMIHEPAVAAGLSWESQDGVSLEQAILREASASPESLALLEYVLDQLYERRRGSSLTFDAYWEFGGLLGSIAATAETCVVEHVTGGCDVLVRTLRLLVRVDPSGASTRRYARREEFPAETPESHLLDALIERRLCVTDAPGGFGAVAFSHEALLRAWPRLQSWLLSETSLLQARELVTADAAEWCRRGRPASLLATAPEKVADAKRLMATGVPLSNDTDEYVQSSLRRTVWLHRLRVAAVGGISALAVIAVGAAVYARSERDEALQARAQALARESERALSAGDHDNAIRLVQEAAAVWKDRAGRPDPEVRFEQLRTDLVREVQPNSRAHEPLTDWYFSSGVLRRSSLLFLGTSYGDSIVVVDPVSGRSTLLKNFGSNVISATRSPNGRYRILDDSGTLTGYDGQTGERTEVLPDAFSMNALAAECDGAFCEALGWNPMRRRCEWMRIDVGSTYRVSQPLEPKSGPSGPVRFDSEQACAWDELSRLSERSFVAIDHARRAFLIEVDEKGGPVATFLRDKVDVVAVVDESTVFVRREGRLELMNPVSGRFEVKSSNTPERLSVSVRGGMLAAVSSEGAVEIFRNGRIYSLGRTGLHPIRVFEFQRSRAVFEVNSSGLVRTIDYQSGRELYRWQAAPTPLRAAFFSAAEHRLSLLTTAGSLYVWDISGLEATDIEESIRGPSSATPATGVARQSIALDPMRGGEEWANEERLLVLVDPQADLAVVRASREGVLLHRGNAYRMRDFRPSTSTRTTDGASWLLSDGRRVVRLGRPSAASTHPARPEILWEGRPDDTEVELILALDGGGVAVVLRGSITLLDAQGAERARVSRDSFDQRMEGELVRAREVGEVLVIETATCHQRRIHVPTSRILYEVDRLCGGDP
ncbi:ATP-binding protein [Accumulibacter sp.]|uniref:ATP-binding protein n=1 Tax=Accumulibacter sp. TaxID=2053492 RepID=UPI00262E94C5|nr:ATP-binding protein [Accumulibacter sp.]